MDAQQADSELMKLINGFQISQAIHIAASLGIADVLKDGARPSADIAAATGAHPGAMYRLLHALASVGVLEEHADAHFALTPIGDCLRSDAPRSHAAWARHIGRPYVWRSWGEMRHSVMTGEPAFQHVHGTGLWEWRAGQPEETAIFDAAMTEFSSAATTAVAAAFDFSRFACIMDVGGGRGALLAGILRQHPTCRGILFDQPHVVSAAPDVLQAHGVTGRCEIVAGSMFAGIPAGADAYLIMHVLMDHDDDEVHAILLSCRSVIGPDGRLIVVERLMSEPNRRDPQLADITMLTMTGGRLRTPAQFTALFADAGFAFEQSVTTGSPDTMLIGAPV